MAEPHWHEGGCFCGDIRDRVRGEAVWKAGCTCQDCVRIQAAPYVVWAGFDQANFELLRGTPTVFHSSPNVVRQFCPRCGSTLTYRKDAEGRPDLAEAASVIYIAVPGLDDPWSLARNRSCSDQVWPWSERTAFASRQKAPSRPRRSSPASRGPK